MFDVPSSTIHVAREMLVNKMIIGGYEWIFFIDSDMTFAPDLLERLLSHDAPVVSAMCFKRISPYTPCFYRTCEMTDHGVHLEPFEFGTIPRKPFEVAAAGAACMLIRREVFEKIKYPWFLPLPFCGEDISFCLKLQKAEIPILVDPKPIVGHIETRAVDVFTYLEEKARTEGTAL
jgi:GT2 family glycosyltransferase